MAEQKLRFRPLGPMDDRWTAEPSGADRIVNMTYDRDGVWRTCGGFDQAITYGQTPGRIHSIHWFAQHQGGRQWVVFEERESGKDTLALKYVRFDNDSTTSLQTGRTRVKGPTAGTTYLENANWLYVLNGYDKPIRWNGRELVRVGFDAPPPPPQVQAVGYDQADADYTLTQQTYSVNGFQRGVGDAPDQAGGKTKQRFSYGYAVSWINDIGMESPPSAVAWIDDNNQDTAAAGGATGVFQFRRTIMVETTEAPSHARGVRLWRTADVHDVSAVGQEGVTLYLLAEVPSAGAFTYYDDHADDELGAQLNYDATGVFPPARYAQTFKGTMFVDAGAESPSRVRYSAPLFIEQMPAVNYLTCGDATTGPITGLKSTKNALVVFKRRGIYLIKGDPLNGFYTETLTEDVGCTAPRSLVEIPGLGTMFVSDDGPYVLIGALENTGSPTDVRFIGSQIANVWRTEVNTKALESCRAARNTKDREVWLHVPTDGDDRPQLGLVWSYEANGWSVREGFPFSCLTEARDHRGHIFAGSHSTTSGEEGVLVYGRGHNLGQGSLSSEWRSAWLTLEERVPWPHTEITTLNVGRALTLEWHVDRDVATWQDPPDDTVRQKDQEFNRSAWNTAIWDTDPWEPRVPVQVKFDHYQASGNDLQWRATAAKLEILGVVLTVVPIGDIPQLNKRVS